jgi:hypothetical protein
MGKKSKNKQNQQQKRRERKRHDRKARHPTPHRPEFQAAAGPRLPPIDPPEPERCLPAIHIDAAGKPVPDPHAELGIPRDASDEAVLAAFQARILERPPERDPEGARRLLDARQRLLDEDHALERALGVLHVPDPAAVGLPTPAATESSLPVRERIIGQLALYALLEATLLGGSTQAALDLG